MPEPTLDEVRAAVLSLPERYLVELSKGPLEIGDPDDCRICELFDAWVYGHSPDARWAYDDGGCAYVAEGGPHDDAILLLIDYHRWWASPARDGNNPEAWRRCQQIYALAAKAVSAKPTAADLADLLGLDTATAERVAATIASQRAADTAAGLPACRTCGCTPNASWIGGCGWAEPDLCTRCAEKAALAG